MTKEGTLNAAPAEAGGTRQPLPAKVSSLQSSFRSLLLGTSSKQVNQDKLGTTSNHVLVYVSGYAKLRMKGVPGFAQSHRKPRRLSSVVFCGVLLIKTL